MLIYSILMFAISILFFILSALIYRGNTKLIHDYHQTKVTDKKGYAKEFSKALVCCGFAPLISGIVGLFGNSNKITIVSVVVLIAGLIIGFGQISRVQNKYNNGLF